MLRQVPLTDFLSLSSYAPAHTPNVVPATTIKPPHFAPLAA
ncbi:MAG TPA: hypothetical protein PKE64_20730 [Anaerolineae bacterium]|nr:hypothetical protein [Anaerolineae bacterium]HMR66445.1 hypothetical protein [Anaerolineae bacterium]